MACPYTPAKLLAFALIAACSDPTDPLDLSPTDGGGLPDAGACAPRISPQELSFGAVQPTKVLWRTIEIENPSPVTCRYTLFIEAEPGARCAHRVVDEQELAVEPGARASVQVEFAPGDPCSHACSLVVRTESHEHSRIRLSGVGASSVLALIPGEVGFGTLPVGDSRRRTLTVYSTGSEVLDVVDWQGPAAPFSADGQVAPFSIEPGASHAWALTVTATLPGSYAGSLTVYSTVADRCDPTEVRVVSDAVPVSARVLDP